MNPLERLRYHVTGAIERGEQQAVIEQPHKGVHHMPQLTPYNFFLKHAGYSYDLAKETRMQGRQRCARSLAHAERTAHATGHSYTWEYDDLTSAEHIDKGEDGSKGHNPWTLWACYLRNDAGQVIGSLHGIDFGRDGEPWGNPYRRCVEAELALEYIEQA